MSAALGPQAARAECYAPAEVEEIAKAIRQLGECEDTLAIRERFIAEQKLAPVPLSPWWAEPTVIVAGTVVSFAAGTVLGVYLMRR